MSSRRVGDGNGAQRNNVKTLPFFRAQWTDIFTSSNSNFKEVYLINCLDLTSWLDEEGYALQNKNIHISLPLTTLKQAKFNSTFTRSKAVSSPSISKNIFHLCSYGAKKKKQFKRYQLVFEKSYTIYLFRKQGQRWKALPRFADDHRRFQQLFMVKYSFSTSIQGSHIGIPKQGDGGHVCVPKELCGSLTLFFYKHFLFSQ